MSGRITAFAALCLSTAAAACSAGQAGAETVASPMSETVLAVRLIHPPCSRLCGSLEVTFWADGHGLTVTTSATGERTECHWTGRNAAFDSIASLIHSRHFFQLRAAYVGDRLHQPDAVLQVRTGRRTFTVRRELGPAEVPEAFRLLEAAMDGVAASVPC